MEELLDVDLGGPVVPAAAPLGLGNSPGIGSSDGLGSSGTRSTSALGVASGLGGLASPPATDPWGMPIQRPQVWKL